MIFSTSNVDVELHFFCTNLENLRILTLYSESYSFTRKPIFNNKIIWIFNYILILLIYRKGESKINRDYHCFGQNFHIFCFVRILGIRR